MAKAPYGQGNGGYAKRKPVTDKPNPQKTPKKPYDYSGKDARRLSRGKK